MAKLLLSVLGKGQVNLTEKREYRKAKYYLEDDSNKTVCETPYVAEAILTLDKNIKYDKFVIYGTKKSMWGVLFYDTLSKLDAVESEFEEAIELNSKDINGEVIQEDLHKLEAALSNLHKLETKCVIIDTGYNREELWNIFNVIIHLNVDVRDRISIDITHGLRFQPLILFLGLMYFRAVKPFTRVEKIYYGALEMSEDFGGKTPIMNLKDIIEMTEWIEAASTFNNFGDSTHLSELLEELLVRSLPPGKSMAAYNQQINKIKSISEVLELNDFRNIETTTKEFDQSLKFFDRTLEAPQFKLIHPLLKELPEKLLSCRTKWETLVELSEIHWNSKRFGFAILSLWEGVINFFASQMGVNEMDKFSFERVSREICYKKNYSKRDEEFANQLNILRKLRNSLTHADTRDRHHYTDIMEYYPKVLSYIKSKMLTVQFNGKIH